MSSTDNPTEKVGLSFFAAWLLLHEKADDWIRDALRRARETPDDLRQEYQRFLISVEREKEALKGVLSEALANEIRQMGFLDQKAASGLRAEVDGLMRRLRGLEEKLERFVARGEN